MCMRTRAGIWLLHVAVITFVCARSDLCVFLSIFIYFNISFFFVASLSFVCSFLPQFTRRTRKTCNRFEFINSMLYGAIHATRVLVFGCSYASIYSVPPVHQLCACMLSYTMLRGFCFSLFLSSSFFLGFYLSFPSHHDRLYVFWCI